MTDADYLEFLKGMEKWRDYACSHTREGWEKEFRFSGKDAAVNETLQRALLTNQAARAVLSRLAGKKAEDNFYNEFLCGAVETVNAYSDITGKEKAFKIAMMIEVAMQAILNSKEDVAVFAAPQTEIPAWIKRAQLIPIQGMSEPIVMGKASAFKPS